MRFLVLCVLAILLHKSNGGPLMQAYVALYCPSKTNWNYEVILRDDDNEELKSVKGEAKSEIEFVKINYMESDAPSESEFKFEITHTCTKDGSSKNMNKGYSLRISDLQTIKYYLFNAANLQSDSHEDVYEKLFVHYMNEECPSGDCSSIRDRVTQSCGYYMSKGDECRRGLDNAFKSHMKSTPTSVTTDTTETGKSNTTTFIIIGSVVGVVLLISLIVTYFLCKKKKNKQTGSGMTGPGTNSKTMTKSGTTKQGTTTGTFQKTGTVGTGNTGNTTTGGQRY
ncbi:unnamed protein product [Caenorhabditis brenneri]